MTCREFIEFLIDYLGGDLLPDERFEFDRHLHQCPDCQAYLATYEQTVQLEAGAFPHVDHDVPPGVPEGLLSAIMASRKKS
ncbi:MAG: zf-HC2 domain-containing protein [Candidatus Eisenbacteria bacterium]|nr:zf-HC2 domain-containing protein [Candidatus Eisenbacteria bacterium]